MRLSIVFLFLSISGILRSQTNDSLEKTESMDATSQPMTVATVRHLYIFASKSAVAINRQDIDKQSPYSLTATMNSVPGVRMEERSPGSYRLSIRGSLLRSPFGVRNIKIYLSEFPLTDAGGNTYLNSLDMSHIGSIQIHKGPSASEFGANTGGAVIISPVRSLKDSGRVIVGLSGGSYGLFAQNVYFRTYFKRSILTLNQGYQRSDGYRSNSAMNRQYWQAAYTFHYSKKTSLEFLALYSSLYYQTPGGLTLQQYNANPQSARPSTPALPGAEQQKAAVRNKTLFGGVKYEHSFAQRWLHVLAVSASTTDFKNPFITNFETRKENSLALRTFLTYQKRQKTFNIGIEAQQTNSSIDNYGNNAGGKDSLQASDILKARQAFLFSQFRIRVFEYLSIDASLSYNLFNYAYRSKYPVHTDLKINQFHPQLMPRLGFSWSRIKQLNYWASFSMGYSTPSIAEVRSSNTIINTSLQAEKAQNIEAGIRLTELLNFMTFDIAVFHYELNNAIVRRTDSSGNEYFINAGRTKQDGMEARIRFELLKPRTSGFIRSLTVTGNLSWYNFRFRNYQVSGNDYSGKQLTGTPAQTSTESIYVTLPENFSLFVQYYYVSAIFLNDANTDKAKSYQLLQLKAEWKHRYKKTEVALFAGIDNALNEVYSLGNDLNAAAGRYYNAATPRNYYGGIKLSL